MRPRPSAGLTPYTWSSLGVPRRNPMTRRPLVRLSSRVSSSAARMGLFSGVRGAEHGDFDRLAPFGDGGGHHRRRAGGDSPRVMVLGEADPLDPYLLGELAFLHAVLVALHGAFGIAVAGRSGPGGRESRGGERSPSRPGRMLSCAPTPFPHVPQSNCSSSSSKRCTSASPAATLSALFQFS